MNPLNIIFEIDNDNYSQFEALYSFQKYIKTMNCSSIAQLSLGCKTNKIAGVHRLYMIAFDDLTNLPNTREVFSLDENGEIEAVGIKPGKQFVEIGALRGTVGLAEVLNKDYTKGISFLGLSH